ncbi:hypothetical protein DKX38_024542 [Salix brachista]|uniref:Uncharacterized protein n=1 Tax=Salix brachista TaxID=2182728 RepID=A0A5N5JSA0_9ROSI|nr:hypothetical protein DKX38_024542 [Salix brachista]
MEHAKPCSSSMASNASNCHLTATDGTPFADIGLYRSHVSSSSSPAETTTENEESTSNFACFWNDVSSSNQYVKAFKPSNPVPAYDSQITELKLIENLPMVAAMKSILYDDDASVLAEAQAMVSLHQQEAEYLSLIAELN